MQFEWDEARDAANRDKHGIGLDAARRLDWAAAHETVDARADYGEARFICLVPLDGRLSVCVYTLRNGQRRMISLRKANRREIRTYVEATRAID